MKAGARTQRGSSRNRCCSAGCNEVETINHVLEVCPRRHGARVKCHDNVVQYIAKSCRQRGFSVALEQKFKTGDMTARPDIVATKGEISLVLNCQIISDQYALDLATSNKEKKYESNVQFMEQLPSGTKVLSVTLNWKDVRSAHQLLEENLISKKD